MYYFASDIHLGLDGANTSAEREKLFVKWLDEVSRDARAIFLVGDIFDFWFEFRRVVPKGFTRTLGKLTELCDKGVEVHFFTGNHDMWAYDYLRDECGVVLHKGPCVFDLYGKKIFIAHGDNMYLKKPFREGIMHMLFRSPVMRWIAGHLVHPDFVMRLGLRWSAQSRKSHPDEHAFCGDDEYLVRYAREYQAKNRSAHIDYFVFGHIHCARMHGLGDGSTAVFLGEWLSNPVYAVMRENGMVEIKSYP